MKGRLRCYVVCLLNANSLTTWTLPLRHFEEGGPQRNARVSACLPQATCVSPVHLAKFFQPFCFSWLVGSGDDAHRRGGVRASVLFAAEGLGAIVDLLLHLQFLVHNKTARQDATPWLSPPSSAFTTPTTTPRSGGLHQALLAQPQHALTLKLASPRGAEDADDDLDTEPEEEGAANLALGGGGASCALLNPPQFRCQPQPQPQRHLHLKPGLALLSPGGAPALREAEFCRLPLEVALGCAGAAACQAISISLSPPSSPLKEKAQKPSAEKPLEDYSPRAAGDLQQPSCGLPRAEEAKQLAEVLSSQQFLTAKQERLPADAAANHRLAIEEGQQEALDAQGKNSPRGGIAFASCGEAKEAAVSFLHGVETGQLMEIDFEHFAESTPPPALEHAQQQLMECSSQPARGDGTNCLLPRQRTSSPISSEELSYGGGPGSAARQAQRDGSSELQRREAKAEAALSEVSAGQRRSCLSAATLEWTLEGFEQPGSVPFCFVRSYKASSVILGVWPERRRRSRFPQRCCGRVRLKALPHFLPRRFLVNKTQRPLQKPPLRQGALSARRTTLCTPKDGTD